jgi:hypothetical protein
LDTLQRIDLRFKFGHFHSVSFQLCGRNFGQQATAVHNNNNRLKLADFLVFAGRTRRHVTCPGVRPARGWIAACGQLVAGPWRVLRFSGEWLQAPEAGLLI